jgi:NodT family efflux transporter outer membrane factor (OMF) lipoprotein
MNTRFRVIRLCLFAIPAVYLLIFSGCKVGPDYVRPESAVPDQWHEKAVQGLEDGSADLETWWTLFNDPVLEDLIGRSRAENLDLQIAAARIMESRALLGVASGEYWPNVDAGGFYSRDRVSENGLSGIPSGDVDETNLHSIGVDASWEIDVFGRIGRSVESAQASMQATVEDYRDVLVSLYSEVAQSYISLRSLQTRIQYAVDNAALQRDTLKLTQDRREAGLVPQLDVEQAKLVLASTEAVIPSLRQREAEAIHRLGVLQSAFWPLKLRKSALRPRAYTRPFRCRAPLPLKPSRSMMWGIGTAALGDSARRCGGICLMGIAYATTSKFRRPGLNRR